VARKSEKNGIAGIAFAAAAGFGIGLVAGLVAGEWLGGVHPERVRQAVRRLGPRVTGVRDPHAVERAVLRALKSDPRTRNLPIGVRWISNGLVELTGTVPAAELRRHAAEIAQAAAGEDVVVNRLLVEGEDVG
jgi:osmotically-inducible protein OsmY